MSKLKLATVSEFKIDRGVPVPAAGSGAQKYPFPQMAVGDSIVAPPGARTAAYNWGKANGGKKFRCRAEGPTAVRIWRIS